MKPNRIALAALASGLMAHAGNVGAHHAIGADYDPDNYITVEALVKEFRFINPHPYVTADVVNEAGETEEWRLLLDDRWELVEDGFSRSTLQPGDRLVVTGMPARRQSEQLYVRSIERPADGFLYTEDLGEDEAASE